MSPPSELAVPQAALPGCVQSITRYVALGPALASAGQPNEAQIAALAAQGFEVVINLALHDDPRYSLPDEAASVAAVGMDYVHIPVQFAAPNLSQLQAFFEAMEGVGGALCLTPESLQGWVLRRHSSRGRAR